ncbi:unnamed protein product [Thelazia callipaeda]|uniref:Uncharacterized protein n=1 Tax=Thelazia callipaeda TaxID=103827 RepID=A0A0N5DB16_THECL|nr:unnamed protein product [Thelazia callipaeda]
MIKSSSNSSYNTLKTERPWRQRMADSARLRNVQGNEASETMHSTLTAARVRRNNISSQRNGRSNSGDDLRNSINALKNLIDDRTTGLFRRNNRLPSRESSSTFSDKYSVKNLLSSTNQYVPMRDLYSSRMNALEFAGCISSDLIAKPLRFPEQSNTNNLYEYAKEFVLSKLPLNSHTSENSRGRESSRRLLSSRERTMRHHSRNQVLADSDSSSGNEERTGSRERPLRRRMRKKLKDEEKLREKLPPPTTLGIEKIDADFGKKKKEIEEEEEEDRMKNLHMEYSQVLDNSETSSSMAILTTLCSSEEEESKPTKSEKGKENSLSITNSNVRKKFDLSEYLSTRKESTFWRDI